MSESASSSSTVRPLYLWPEGTDLGPVKAAVEAANLPFKVRPFWFQPGKHARCIALAPDFPFIAAEHVYPRSPGNATLAIQWFFDLVELPHVHTTQTKLEKVFGEDVNEVWDGAGFPDTAAGWPA